MIQADSSPANPEAEASEALPPGEPLADMAAAEFTRRRDTARRKVAAGELDPHAANRHLLPWLALAAHLGADLPELWFDTEIIAPSSRAGDPVRVRTPADEIAPLEEVRAAIATARDVAIDRACTFGAPAGDATAGVDPVRNERARRLQALAIAVGARPYLPTTAKREKADA